MVTICNGKHRVTVSDGAYFSIYKSMGYSPVQGEEVGQEAPSNTPEVEETEVVGLEENEEEVEELIEKPISEWSLRELREVASNLGIPASGKSKQELKDLILEKQG
jgi:hypothetical protein